MVKATLTWVLGREGPAEDGTREMGAEESGWSWGPCFIYLPSFRIGNQNYNLYLVSGRFPAELGPETRSNGSGSKNGAERTQK